MTGQQERLPLKFELPTRSVPELINYTPAPLSPAARPRKILSRLPCCRSRRLLEFDARIALFDPDGATRELLSSLGIACQGIEAGTDLSAYDILIVGKSALKLDGAAPSIDRVRDGLKVIVFEQTAQVLEKRLGFRVQEFGLRQVFPRIPDHPVLSGVAVDTLRDWRGEATILSRQLDYQLRPLWPDGPLV